MYARFLMVERPDVPRHSLVYGLPAPPHPSTRAISWNIRGLNTLEKQSLVTDLLANADGGVAILVHRRPLVGVKGAEVLVHGYALALTYELGKRRLVVISCYVPCWGAISHRRGRLN